MRAPLCPFAESLRTQYEILKGTAATSEERRKALDDRAEQLAQRATKLRKDALDLTERHNAASEAHSTERRRLLGLLQGGGGGSALSSVSSVRLSTEDARIDAEVERRVLAARRAKEEDGDVDMEGGDAKGERQEPEKRPLERNSQMSLFGLLGNEVERPRRLAVEDDCDWVAGGGDEMEQERGLLDDSESFRFVRVTNVEESRCIDQRSHVTAVSIRPDMKTIAVGSLGHVLEWDISETAGASSSSSSAAAANEKKAHAANTNGAAGAAPTGAPPMPLRCLQLLTPFNPLTALIATPPPDREQTRKTERKRYLGLAGETSAVRLFSTSTGTLKTVLEGHTDDVYSASISSCGRFVGTCCADSLFTLWSLDLDGPAAASSSPANLSQSNKNKSAGGGLVGPRASFVWSHRRTSRRAALHQHENRMAEMPPFLARDEQTCEVFARYFAALCLAFSPDSTKVAVGYEDGVILLFAIETETGEGVGGVADSSARVCRRLSLFVPPCDASSRVFTEWQAEQSRGVTRAAMCLAFGPDSIKLAVQSSCRRIFLWRLGHDHPTGVCLKQSAGLGGRFKSCRDDSSLMERHGGGANSVALRFHPSLPLVFSAGRDGCLDVLSMEGERLFPYARLQEHIGAITSVDVAPSGKILLTGGEDRMARVWRLSAEPC
uniref:Striatin N-terminal domain-containing protein n=1 Tax=Chromera velia CCMP2878 TaxID=1169474 RepID=A0A0G4IBD9_9ALVE|eukprot:Cvel_12796.t1-p1 / transcript=Cvel_12796.t1 / gene=Cvel_12796 / organism=Chromera_velia_CCMP2878 / gene_product=hypothetical protein / transcript_product=hypothetical protein / location=Cvel_scaffold852:5460-14556(-) / protein_length=664 / sequence_SO=supercontig / SO=protein_coding / is_pseudo=false